MEEIFKKYCQERGKKLLMEIFSGKKQETVGGKIKLVVWFLFEPFNLISSFQLKLLNETSLG